MSWTSSSISFAPLTSTTLTPITTPILTPIIIPAALKLPTLLPPLEPVKPVELLKPTLIKSTVIYVSATEAKNLIKNGGYIGQTYISAYQASHIQKSGGILGHQYIKPGELNKGGYFDS